MEHIVISNTEELKVELARLQAIASVQKGALAARFKGPAAIFSTVKSLFRRSGGNVPGLLKNVSRSAILFALNRIIFRNANFFVKGIMGIVSWKAAGFVTGKSLEGGYLFGKNLLNKFFSKTNKMNTRKSINLKADA